MDQFAHDPFDVEPSGDTSSQRGKDRDSLFLTAQFRIVGAPKTDHVRVRNLSAGGLMAEVAEPVPQGTAIELELRGVGCVTGRVAWNAAGRVGVAFDQMIDPILARKPVIGGTKTPVFTKPILPILPTR